MSGRGARPRSITHDVEVLIDGDSVSWGLAEGTDRDRATDSDFAAALAAVLHASAARACGVREGHPPCRRALHCAASTLTAKRHLAVLAAAPNNTWQIRRGLDGADHALLHEFDRLASLASARRRAGSGLSTPLLVVLVGQDHIYTEAVRHLRAAGLPTWLITPGRNVSASLTRVAADVTPLRAIA